MKVSARELEELKLRETARLYADLITALLQQLAGEKADHLRPYLADIAEQETARDVVEKLCEFVDHIDETLVMADLLSREERARFVLWAGTIARLGKEPVRNVFRPFDEAIEIRIDVPQVEVIDES